MEQKCMDKYLDNFSNAMHTQSPRQLRKESIALEPCFMSVIVESVAVVGQAWSWSKN